MKKILIFLCFFASVLQAQNVTVLVDPATGELKRPTVDLFISGNPSIGGGGGGGGGAPTNADYLVKTANASLSAERVVTDTATIAADWSTAGQVKFNLADANLISISSLFAPNSYTLTLSSNATLGGTNTGDQDLSGYALTSALSGYVPTSRTINGQALSGNVTVSASDVGLGNVTNDAQTKAAVVPNTLPSSGQILVGNAGATAYAPVSMSGKVSMTNAGVTSVSLSSGDIPNNAANTSGTAANLSGTPALPNGTTATTQTAGDNTTKLATTAFVTAAVSGGGMTNPMTTAGDIIYGGASGAPTRKAQGSDGTFLGVSGGVLDYYTPAGGGNVSNSGTPTSGQIATWTSSTVIQGVGASTLSDSILGGLSSSGFVKRTGTNTYSVDTSTYLTGNQSISFSPTGDVSSSGGSGATSLTPALTVTKINGTSLAGLSTGILKNTTTTGVPSIAVAGTDYLTPTGSAASLTSFPTFNQNTTGSAATLTTGRTIAITGDLAYTSGSFNGSSNVTGTGTLATVNSNVGSFTNANITVNAKGLITAASNGSGGGTPAGSTGDIQINSAGSFGALTPGTGIATALGINVGSAGAPVLFNGAGGTPSSVTLTNATGLPVSGITSSTITALGVGTLELGAASDTTLSRSSAGVLAVEGVVVPSISSTNTLTNKRVTARVLTVSSSATPTANTDNADVIYISALAAAVTNMSTNLTGTPVASDQLEYWIVDNGTARAISWGSAFTAGPVSLPTTTVLSKPLHVYFERDPGNTSWVCMGTSSNL